MNELKKFMTDEYQLWKVTYRCKARYIDGEDSITNSFLVVATSPAEALRKADSCFIGSNDLNQELLAKGRASTNGVELSDLCKTACEYQKRISFPKLTLDSDKDKFDLQARIDCDGRALKFLVFKK